MLTSLAGIDSAYFWICGLIAALGLFFIIFRRVVTEAAPQPSDEVARRGIVAVMADAIGSRWALLGGAAIFLYVGAEVAIGTQMAFFLHSDAIWGRTDAPFAFPLIGHIMGGDGIFGVSAEEAGKAVALYWGGAMVGRLVGSALLARIPASRLLAAFTFIACLMCLYVLVIGGVSAGVVALCIGLFNSIMFPVIFTLTLERTTASEEATSGFLCFSIIGGAAIPPLVGYVSGMTNYVTAFIVPAICYAVALHLLAGGGARPRATRGRFRAGVGALKGPATDGTQDDRRRGGAGGRFDQDRLARAQRRAERAARHARPRRGRDGGAQLPAEPARAQPGRAPLEPDRPRLRKSKRQLCVRRAIGRDGALPRGQAPPVHPILQRPRRPADRRGARDDRADPCRRPRRHAASLGQSRA